MRLSVRGEEIKCSSTLVAAGLAIGAPMDAFVELCVLEDRQRSNCSRKISLLLDLALADFGSVVEIAQLLDHLSRVDGMVPILLLQERAHFAPRVDVLARRS